MVIGFSSLMLVLPSSAAPPSDTQLAFDQVWQKVDGPVADGSVSRSWIWGADRPVSWLEPYAETPGGWRAVGYTDKGRMELNDPQADPASPWYVTSGRLAYEMISGKVQLGDNTFSQDYPAMIQIAGDPGDELGPTYAAFAALLYYRPIPTGWRIIQTVGHYGSSVSADPGLARYGVTAEDVGAATDHTVASVFLQFMDEVSSSIYGNRFYITGLPITEAYWAKATVDHQVRDVLVQCFERRCLTYTPSNPDGWKVELANDGQHYREWRYDQLGYGRGIKVHAVVAPGDVLIFLTVATVGNARDYFTLPLEGIQTLKPGECAAAEAWSYTLQRLLAPDQQEVLESPIGMVGVRGDRIWLGNGTSELFNETLVQEGYARVDMTHPDPLYFSRLLAAQQRAQQEGKGVWGSCQ